MKKFRPFTFFIFVFSVLFLIFAPTLIKTGLNKNPGDEKEKFKGILSLWQVSGFKAGELNIANYMGKCIKSFESKNEYVFIEMSLLRPEKAEEKLEEGESPDLISFPAGFFDNPDNLMQTEIPPYIKNNALKKSGAYGGKTFALPFIAAPYLLYVNKELLFEKEIEEQALDELTLESLLSYAKILSHTKKEGKKEKQIYGIAFEGGCCPYASLAFFDLPSENNETTNNSILALDTPDNISVSYDNGFNLFINGEAAFLIAPANGLGVLKNSKKTPPDFTVCAFSSFTDMIQYMGVIKTPDSAKAGMCKKFIYSLYSEKNQKRAEDLKAAPMVYYDELYADDPVFNKAGAALLQKGVFPNAFGYSKTQDALKGCAEGLIRSDYTSINNIKKAFF